LVSTRFFASTVWAFAFHEPVRQKALVMRAVKHLCLLLENVTVLLDFKQDFLNKFFMHRAFSAGVIVKGSVPSAKKFGYADVIAVS
jgi:hypothetical protein